VHPSPHRVLLLVVVAALAGASACSSSAPGAETAAAPSVTTTTTTTPPTTAPPPPTTAPPCVPDPSLTAPAAAPPAGVVAAVDRFGADPGVAAGPWGVSVWIDGYGEIARQPDLPLLPASNQKLFTAMGALAVLGPDARLTTEVRVTPDGGLAIVAGGDPTITGGGPHSIDALAAQVRAAGITHVAGPLLVDESHHDAARRASGWQDWHVPAYAGPLSAFMVDRNRYRGDPAFLADPALANAERFRAALGAHGVTVAGPTAHGPAPAGGPVVASLTSAPMAALVDTTLMRSDNMAAELILKEVGRAGAGEGSSAAGAAATRAALAPLCVPIAGVDDDGSGLSRANGRSAREWRVLLQGARTQPWAPLLVNAMPLAGRTGTLAGRFHGTAAEGNVRAKTGTIIGGIALSGYGTTLGGRAFVFSVIAAWPTSKGGQGALDALVAAVAADTS
jgi:serine-type D-Ala-D-Ala carboxypeptidase/endopeptidase (penicillin-binding protein 4)